MSVGPSDQPVLLRRIRLKGRHAPREPGGRRRGPRNPPAPRELRVVRYPDEDGVYLLFIGPAGEEIDAAWHQNVPLALGRAESEFGVQEREWEVLGE